MKQEAFKTCPNCRHEWSTLEEFLSDPALELAGYQVHFHDQKGGLFLYTHVNSDCLTTLAVPVKSFLSLSDLPLLADRLCHGSELCVRKGETAELPQQCECQWVKHILEIIQNWEKKA